MNLPPSFFRCAIAALAGSAVSLCVPLFLALKGILSKPLQLPDGSPDDGYTHLMVMVLFLWPIMYLALSLFNTLLFRTMIRFGFFNKTAMVSVAAASACMIFIPLGFKVPETIIMVLSFAGGSLMSWWIAAPRLNK